MPLSVSGARTLGEYAFGGIPPKLRLEHLADAGEWHRVDWDNLHGNGGALRRALADPGFELGRLRQLLLASTARSRPAIRPHRHRADRRPRQGRRRDAET